MWTLIIIFIIGAIVLGYIVRSVLLTLENGIPDFSDEQDKEYDRTMNAN